MNENEWFIDHREIFVDTTQVLGRGQFATVFKGKWRFLDVAVKKFNPECQPTDRIHLKKEIDILIKMHHPHIVQILGVCWNPFMLILEYMPRGNLRHAMATFCFYRAPWCLSFYKKKKWSTQLCIALIYLHERKPQYVIHRDIKPTNVLIDGNGDIKVSDFGLSKLMDMSFDSCNRSFGNDLCSLDAPENNMTKGIGTLYYMAPEVLDPNIKKYDTRVDIWGLGCTLYEIWEEEQLHNRCTVADMYSKQWVPQFRYTPRVLRPLIGGCLEIDPDDRPEARAILDVLYQTSPWK